MAENHIRILCSVIKVDLVYEAPDGSKKHNRLWNGGNGWGTVRLYEKTKEGLVLIEDAEASHIGCEYGEYGEPE